MSDIVPVPNVEVTENGVPIPQERLDPAVAAFIMQSVTTANLVKLRKLEESKVPIGTKPIKRTVTDSVMEIRLSPPWISFSLINDGAGAVTVWTNNEGDPLQEGMVASGESYSCDMRYAVIKSVYLKTVSGTSATVRIFGKEGKPL